MTTPRIGEIALARGVTATWWYTAIGVFSFVGLNLVFWVPWMLIARDRGEVWLPIATIAGAIAWLASSALLLLDYRPSVLAARQGERIPTAPLHVAGLLLAVVGAALFGLGTGSWLAAASVLAFALAVRPWTPGLRWRLVLGVTVLLAALAFIEGSRIADVDGFADVLSLFAGAALIVILVPSMTAFSLWWWEIVLELDRARAAESQLAATRERLRLANDVHDLQGHHLQVIALQLELAERLLASDPDAAAEQIRAAQAAVDEARAGTRALATSFRGVPLPDELENAADLLRAAGHEVRMHVTAGAASAPAEVLGPIVRESVTNALKHGDGHIARIELTQDGGTWVYRMSNDAAHPDEPQRIDWGAGLTGMRERLSVHGGDVEAWNDGREFTVQVRLPAAATAAGAEPSASHSRRGHR